MIRPVSTKLRHPLFAGVDDLLAAGQMTVKDLATWLDRPYMTLKEWLDRGVWPSECFQPDVEARLTLLRECITRAFEEDRRFIPNRRGKSKETRVEEIRALYRLASMKRKERGKWRKTPSRPNVKSRKPSTSTPLTRPSPR